MSALGTRVPRPIYKLRSMQLQTHCTASTHTQGWQGPHSKGLLQAGITHKAGPMAPDWPPTGPLLPAGGRCKRRTTLRAGLKAELKLMHSTTHSCCSGADCSGIAVTPMPHIISQQKAPPASTSHMHTNTPLLQLPPHLLSSTCADSELFHHTHHQLRMPLLAARSCRCLRCRRRCRCCLPALAAATLCCCRTRAAHP